MSTVSLLSLMSLMLNPGFCFVMDSDGSISDCSFFYRCCTGSAVSFIWGKFLPVFAWSFVVTIGWSRTCEGGTDRLWMSGVALRLWELSN